MTEDGRDAGDRHLGEPEGDPTSTQENRLSCSLRG